MSKGTDLVTSGLKRAVDILFVLNPRGTSVGAFAGVVGDGLTRLLAPALERYKNVLDAANVSTYHFLAAGVVIFNIRGFFHKRQLPAELEDAFEAIRRVKGELTPVQLRMQYLSLCSDVIARAKPKPKAVPSRAGSAS